MQKIERNTPLGKLCAAPGGDLDYPGISIYIERPDGVQIDLAYVEVERSSNTASAYIYEDTVQEEWTRKFVWNQKEINTDLN